MIKSLFETHGKVLLVSDFRVSSLPADLSTRQDFTANVRPFAVGYGAASGGVVVSTTPGHFLRC